MLGPVVSHFFCTVTLEIHIIMPTLQVMKSNLSRFTVLAQYHTTSEQRSLGRRGLPEPKADSRPHVGFQGPLFSHWLIYMLQTDVVWVFSFFLGKPGLGLLAKCNPHETVNPSRFLNRQKEVSPPTELRNPCIDSITLKSPLEPDSSDTGVDGFSVHAQGSSHQEALLANIIMVPLSQVCSHLKKFIYIYIFFSLGLSKYLLSKDFPLLCIFLKNLIKLIAFKQNSDCQRLKFISLNFIFNWATESFSENHLN